MINDAVAYLRGLLTSGAETPNAPRHRCVKGPVFTAEEQMQVRTSSPRCSRIAGRVAGATGDARRAVTLDLTGAAVETIDPDWRSRLLAVITNPNVAYSDDDRVYGPF